MRVECLTIICRPNKYFEPGIRTRIMLTNVRSLSVPLTTCSSRTDRYTATSPYVSLFSSSILHTQQQLEQFPLIPSTLLLPLVFLFPFRLSPTVAPCEFGICTRKRGFSFPVVVSIFRSCWDCGWRRYSTGYTSAGPATLLASYIFPSAKYSAWTGTG